MKASKNPRPEAPLPVDAERLRRQFPALTDDDLEAYVAVTRRILSTPDPAGRARLTRELLAKARALEGEKREAASLSPEELILVRYIGSLRKIQGKE